MKPLKRPLILRQRPKKDECEHEWKIAVKMIARDNPAYTQGKAAFKIRTCTKCNKIEYLEYKVEKI